jgi:hypothetical protein
MKDHQRLIYSKADVNTWSADDFDKKITALYNEALKPAVLLQQRSTDQFKSDCLKGNTEKLRPTLFDLLAQNALDYFEKAATTTLPNHLLRLR